MSELIGYALRPRERRWRHIGVVLAREPYPRVISLCAGTLSAARLVVGGEVPRATDVEGADCPRCLAKAARAPHVKTEETD